MKLLYITNGITGSGGLERVLSVKISMLAEDFGYEVHILSLNENGKQPFFDFSNKIVIHNITVGGNPLQYFLQYKSGIQNIVDEIIPNFISVCDDGLKGFFIPTLIRTDAKIIYERHVSKLIHLKGSINFIQKLRIQAKWALMERLAKNFSKFVVLTEGNKKEWPSLQNLLVIENPLSFYPTECSSLLEKTVICVGKISFQKGHDLLLLAWEKVWQKHPDWKLELYGHDLDNFLSTENFALKNIHHFPPERNIIEKYLQSSIYVMSSRFEGFGMVLIEAMACGLPCISFNCNYGPSDILSKNSDGFLVENQNVLELSEKINVLIENEHLRKEMGANAKENVKRFFPQIIVRKWDQLFQSL